MQEAEINKLTSHIIIIPSQSWFNNSPKQVLEQLYSFIDLYKSTIFKINIVTVPYPTKDFFSNGKAAIKKRNLANNIAEFNELLKNKDEIFIDSSKYYESCESSQSLGKGTSGFNEHFQVEVLRKVTNGIKVNIFY